MLAFLDTETTGLNPRRDHLLEVACIVTDDQLIEVARFERVVHWPPAIHFVEMTPENEDAVESPDIRYGVDPIVCKMHLDNGLWRASADSRHLFTHVDLELQAFLQQHAPKAQLAGNSINFDRAFGEVYFPKSLAVLHYRNVDVTSFHEAARRWWPEVHLRGSGPIAHRAMGDAEASLEMMRGYRDALGPRREWFLAGLECGESGDVANYSSWDAAADDRCK